jgi:hypothetical protein
MNREVHVLVLREAGGFRRPTHPATLGKPILGFIFSEKGLIGDVSLEGTKITKIKTTD